MHFFLNLKIILPDTHSFFDIGGRYVFVQVNNKLGKLLYVYYIFGVITARVNYFRASGNLQWLFGYKEIVNKV